MEATTLEPSELPAKPKQRPPRFTRENAGDYARKAVIAREANKRLRLAALGPPDSAQYVASRLTRVRAQLSKLDQLIENETDPQKLDRLVSAQSRLSEQWRIFSGIPLPGSRRPGREKPQRSSPNSGPVDAE
jgi:hypothetical protein